MKIITKEKGGVWSARRHGYAGVFFADTEDLAAHRAQTSKPNHRPPKDSAAVWQPTPNFGVLFHASWFNKSFPGGL
jgi:hypothetical protein